MYKTRQQAIEFYNIGKSKIKTIFDYLKLLLRSNTKP